MLSFEEFLNESVEQEEWFQKLSPEAQREYKQKHTKPTHKFAVVAANRTSDTSIHPVAGDHTELTQAQHDKLMKHAKPETIDGQDYMVLHRDDKSKVGAKTPNINVHGRTSGYSHLFFKKHEG